MKRTITIFALLTLLLPLRLSGEPVREAKDVPANQGCIEQIAQRVAIWKKEGVDRETLDKRVQAELAKCSGVPDQCAAMVGAGNADLAWLGHAVLSGTMTPADYLARVRDRTRKMRDFHKTPSLCAAYARGDADGDLVPDNRDNCPNTPNFAPTDPHGCPDRSLPPRAPSSEAVQRAAQALNIPVSKACLDAPAPDGSAVLKAGLAPDGKAFLFVVSRTENQPPGCQIFYEVDIRIRNVSFFTQRNVTMVYHKVFRASDSLTGALADPAGMTFQLQKADSGVPWSYLTFRTVEPNEISERYFRVRTINGNGYTRGWGAYDLVQSTTFP